MERRSLHRKGRSRKRKNIQTSAGARRSGRRRRSFTVENNWLRRRVLEKKNPGRQQPCWGSLFCTNLTQPTGALDYNTSKEILKLIEDVNKKYGNTIIMVTHNEAIRNMADHVIKLRDGAVRHNERNEHRISAADLEW